MNAACGCLLFLSVDEVVLVYEMREHWRREDNTAFNATGGRVITRNFISVFTFNIVRTQDAAI